ncbi:MAG TPA: WD40 repeat domain-containing protein [Thermoanaerobaculia bacterium]|nr:WD40 repeat domain-containing protein [Thermoanaerobaculia bacterium]
MTAEAAGVEKRPTVELAHEALIGRWKRLQGWIDADREALGVRRRVDEAAREWSAGGGDPSYLYTGARLAQAEEWPADRAGELNASSRAFLAASAARRDAEIEARRRRRRRTIVVRTAVVLVAVLTAAAISWLLQRSEQQRQQAERQRQIQLSTQLADGARLAFASNPLTALLLAAAAVRIRGDLPGARGALLGALALSDAQPLGRSGIVAVAASSDRRSMATAGQDGTVTLWRLEPGTSPAAVRTFRVQGGVADLALSNDRRWLLARDRDGNVRLLDLTGGDQGTRLPDEDWRHGDPFSADSHWLTLDLADTPVRYDLLHGAAREVLAATPALPAGLDANAPAPATAPPDPRSAPLSSGGRWLAWREESGAVRLKDRAFPELPPIELPGQGQPVGFLMFVPGDRWLVTQGGAEAPRLWDLRRFPRGGILAATPDGSRLLVGGPGANVHVEGAGDARPLQGVEPGTGIWAFSPDGSRLACGSPGGKLLLWKLGGRDLAPQTVSGVGVMTGLAFSPRGDRLAIGGEGFLRLWDLGNERPQLLSHDLKNRWVTSLAFGPSPSRLAAGWSHGQFRVSRLDDPGWPPDEAATLDAPVTALAFSPDGRWLAMTDGNGKARLWRNGPGKPLENQDPKVRVLAFSSDGGWLAGGGEEGLLQVWDLGNSSGVPVAWQAHAGPIRALAFAAGARQLITTDRSVRTWPLESGALVRLACEKAGRDLSQDEWKSHAPKGESFQTGMRCEPR